MEGGRDGGDGEGERNGRRKGLPHLLLSLSPFLVSCLPLPVEFLLCP